VYPKTAEEFERIQSGELPKKLGVTTFSSNEKGLATRASSGQVLNSLAPLLPELIGGSADLTGSNKTDIKGEEPYSLNNPAGRYIHFGIREHGMGSILNGIAVHGGLIPYGGTFLVFSDYMRPSIRLAALMELRVIYVFTHDSIGLGEDGPTHQPIEQLAALRVIPNLTVIRPADANEVAVAWLAAVESKDSPVALALTRQAVPTLDREIYNSADGLRKGAYVLRDYGDGEPELILMATGSEVELIIEAGETLSKDGVAVRLVSFPSWELFEKQDDAYRQDVLPSGTTARIAIEAGSSMGWSKWVGDSGVVIGINKFGASAPYKEIYQNYGLTTENLIETANEILKDLEVKENDG
jgi:transketolase